MTKNGSTLSLSLANPPSTTEKWSNIGTGVRHFQPSNFERTIPQGDHTTNFDNRSFGYPPIGVHSTPTAHAEVQPNTLSTAVGKEKTFEGLASDSAKTLGFTEGDTNVVADGTAGQKSYDRYRRRNAQPAIPPIPLSSAEAGSMSENERSMERSNSNNPFLPENMKRGIQHQHPHRYQYPQRGSFGHEDWYYITPHDGSGSDKSTQLGEIEEDGHHNVNIQTYSKVGTFPSTENGNDNLAITDEHPGAVHLRQPTYVSGLESEIHNLRTKLSSLTEDYDKMCDRKEHYKGEYHQTHTDLTKSNERIEHLRKGAREFREMYEQACEISQRNYTSWSESQSNVLHLNGKIRSLLSDQETMQNRIERLESDKVRLYADNHALRSEMKGLDEQVSTYRDGSYQDGLRIAEEKKYSESLQTKVRELEDYIYRNRSGLRDRSQIQREGYERSMYGKGEDEKDYRYEVREPTQAQHDQADQADRSD